MTGQADGDLGKEGRDGAPVYAVETEEMSVWYGGTPAVRNLSMHVPHGSIYGLVGPAGAGKTTTIRTLATLRQPTAGTILVDGIDARTDPAAVRDRIGYLPDFSGVYEGLTVSEYLDFYGSIYQVPPARRRQVTDELLELVNLTGRQRNPVRALSRSMKQQLGMARCLIHDPDVLLLDEPASGMDPQSRLELREILQELSKLGKTVVISSHMLSELAETCTHLGIVRAGELLAEGSVDEIIETVAPAARLHVRLLDPESRDQARRVLAASRVCQQIENEGETALLAEFSGAEEDLAAILGQLVSSGARVIDFTTEHRTLEEVVLQATEIQAQA